MATPNYSYEKRQRELAKKRKAEEKRQKKTHKGHDAPGEDTAATDAGDSAQPTGTAPPPAE